MADHPRSWHSRDRGCRLRVQTGPQDGRRPSQHHHSRLRLRQEDVEEESLLTIEIEDGDFAEGDVSVDCAPAEKNALLSLTHRPAPQVTYNLMGLETDCPLLRIGQKMYEGRLSRLDPCCHLLVSQLRFPLPHVPTLLQGTFCPRPTLTMFSRGARFLDSLRRAPSATGSNTSSEPTYSSAPQYQQAGRGLRRQRATVGH